MRAGIGYDVHPLVKGRRLVLGGVTVPFEQGLDGHSDADVLVHAIIDALLGACALEDIGTHFPDTDPEYEGISSLVLLNKVGEKIKESGYTIENIDATVVCQRPRLADYRDEMRRNIAASLDINIERVSVKASTSAGIGFLGEGKGIATHAVALIERSQQ